MGKAGKVYPSSPSSSWCLLLLLLLPLPLHLFVVVEDFLFDILLEFSQFRQLGVPNWQIVPLSSVFMSTSQRGGHLAVFQKHL